MQRDVEEMQIDQKGDVCGNEAVEKDIMIKNWNQVTNAVKNPFTFCLCLFFPPSNLTTSVCSESDQDFNII